MPRFWFPPSGGGILSRHHGKSTPHQRFPVEDFGVAFRKIYCAGAVNGTVNECVSLPLVAVTVIMYVPAGVPGTKSNPDGHPCATASPGAVRHPVNTNPTAHRNITGTSLARCPLRKRPADQLSTAIRKRVHHSAANVPPIPPNGTNKKHSSGGSHVTGVEFAPSVVVAAGPDALTVI
jgi:hypothetical protein